MNDLSQTVVRPFSIGVDLGGHGLRGVLVSKSGEVLADKKLGLSESERALEEVESKILELLGVLREHSPDADATGIGIGVPGFIEAESGVLRSSPNFPSWVDIPLVDHLSGLAGQSIALENDANCALLGEHWRGAGQGVDDLLLLSLGTGVGSAALIGGRLLKGARGLGAEGGHIPLYPGGRKCGCGLRGCLEAYASGPGLALTAREAWYEEGRSGDAPECTALDVFRIEKEAGGPDPEHWASRGIERYCLDLAQGIAGMVHLLAPSRILLSGGVSGAWSRIGVPVRDALAKRCIPTFVEGGPDLRAAELGDFAGAMGAARLGLGV